MKAPLPSNEAARLTALHQYQILDTPPEKAFDDLTRLAAHICGTPTAQISLVDADRQWFKSKVGLEASETPRDVAFCAHTILEPRLFIVPDACEDDRFSDNPLVTSDPKIRFYAGAPLITPDGCALGALCTMDHVPRELSFQQQEALEVLARQVVTQLQLRRNLAVLKKAITKYKQTETALTESEERYRRLVELSPETIAVHSEGKFDYINTAGAKLLGAANPAELIGKPLKDFIQPNVQQIQPQGNQASLTEEKFVRLDGQVIDVEVTGIPITYHSKPATQVVIRDVTKRKRAEVALRRSEERFRLLVEGVKDYAIFMLDSDGCIVSWNAGAECIKGYQSAEILGQHFSCFYPAEDIQQGKPQQGLRVAAFEGRFEEEGWRLRKDGTQFWANVLITALHNESGQLQGFSKLTRDISERKQAEEATLRAKVAEATTKELEKEINERKQAEAALQSSVATNRALINAIPDLIFRFSKNGTFVNYKAAKEKHLLMPPSEFLGKTVYEVLPPEVAQPTMHCVETALSTGEIQTFEYQLPLQNQLRDYEARLVVSAADEVMAIVRDITERKQAEVDIRNALAKEKELSELKSRFVSMTSHEFRTPLTTILSSAELLHDYGDRLSEEKKNQHLQRIATSVQHMTQLLNDVLLIGKAEAGKLEFRPQDLDLVEFCRDLVDEMQFSSRSHTITFVSQSDCTIAYIDEKLLRFIISNLLTNAIKYSHKGSTVNLILSCEQTEAIFQVQDQGIGIPAADQVQLFDSFYRASNVGTISGTGMGLSIVKKAVDLHDGKITVASEVGFGTTFTVSLPLNKQVNG